ncbi:MAG: hypothetical protein ACP5KE_09555 [Candidatus Methanodesulfokora sp.]
MAVMIHAAVPKPLNASCTSCTDVGIGPIDWGCARTALTPREAITRAKRPKTPVFFMFVSPELRHFSGAQAYEICLLFF